MTTLISYPSSTYPSSTYPSSTYPSSTKLSNTPYNNKSVSSSNRPISSYSSHCNNCGINGHTFSNCKFPITSVGLIAFRSNSDFSRLGVVPQTPRRGEPHNELILPSAACGGGLTGTPPVVQYLLICRKDTIGFIEFMRGKYAINNKVYIQNLISEMTLSEKQRLLDNDFATLWHNLWGDCVSSQFRSEEKNARDKFDALKEGISLNNANFSLQTLIEASDTKWTEPEWGFPKGRHNNLEKDLNCGLREFEEETGYPSHCVKVVQNIMPYEEIFTGSNYKSYKHKYYLGCIDVLEKPKRRHQETEISKVEWCSYERALALIRPYNVEKLAVLEKVNKVLTKYTLHF